MRGKRSPSIPALFFLGSALLASPVTWAQSDEGVFGALKKWGKPLPDPTNQNLQCHDGETVRTPMIVRGGLSMPDAIAAAANELAGTRGKLRYASGNLSQQVFNPEYWERDWDPSHRDPARPPGTYRLRQQDDQGRAISPTEAILDILKQPQKYSLECGTASKFFYYLAFVLHLGSSKFNRAVYQHITADNPSGLKIGGGPYEGILGEVMTRTSDAKTPPNVFPGMASKNFVSTLKPGAAVYMINLSPTHEGRMRGLSGENMIFLGGDRFYAFHGLSAPTFVSTDEVRKMLLTAWDSTPEIATMLGPDRVHQKNQEPDYVNESYSPDVAKLAGLVH